MTTTETVTIRATEKVRELASKALEIQDACNPLAVANFLADVQRHFWDTTNGQQYWGTDMGIGNPIALAVLNKLNDLARLEQHRTDCFIRCVDLAAGHDCEWRVHFRN